MKFVSTTALTLTLALGAAAMTATPAVAKKSDSAAPAVKYSDGFRKVAPPVQDALGKKDYAAAKAALPAAQAAATTDDDKYAAATFALQIAQGTNDRKVTFVKPEAARSLCGRTLDWIEAVK